MRIALTNVPPDQAQPMAETLVREGRVACVNFFAVHSVYEWKGEVCSEPEVTLMMKVAADAVDALRVRVVELHPYELPEFVVLGVDTEGSLPAYVAWVRGPR